MKKRKWWGREDMHSTRGWSMQQEGSDPYWPPSLTDGLMTSQRIVPGLSSWPRQQRPLGLAALIPKAGLCPASGGVIGSYQSPASASCVKLSTPSTLSSPSGSQFSPTPFTHSYTYPHNIYTHTFTPTSRHIALTHAHTSRHTHTHTQTQVDIFTHTHAHPQTHTETHIYTYVHTHT